ncbi:MAG: thiamine pyrophosphate-dependent enzyme [Woeseiaceae bacterium]
MTSTEKMTGGEAMIRAAVANGIDTIFGLPGAQIYPMFDAIYRMPEVKHVISRHEQGAGYMALGAAAATGKPSAFAVGPGPGVLNASAALCTADGTNKPVLCLTGHVPSEFLGVGRGHLHELPDQRGTLASIIKHADHISDPTNTSAQVNEAFHQMLSGRPGPASVEMCWDTMAKSWDVEIGPGNTQIDKPGVDEDVVDDAAKLIAKAKNIMIMVGGGALHASDEVLELAETLGAVVTAARGGRGVVSEDHQCGASSAAARRLWEDTDLLIGIGSRLEMQFMRWGSMMEYFDRSPEGGPRVIRIDIDPTEMDRLKADAGIVADAVDGTRALIKAIGKHGHNSGDLDRIAEAKATSRKNFEEIQPQVAYLDVIREILPRDGFFIEELCQVGFATYYAFPVYEPRTFVTCGYQGTLGYGFPTGIGVKAALPDKAAVSIIGDGGFMFGMPELATAVQHNIGLVTIVFNNNSFGNVRRDQQTQYDGHLIGADLVNPDMMKLTEAFGADGYRVSSPDELKPVLAKAIDNDRPAIIEVVVERGSEPSPWKYITSY